MVTLNSLSTELNEWYDKHGLEKLSADEYLNSDDLTDEQNEFILDFVERWDECEQKLNAKAYAKVVRKQLG